MTKSRAQAWARRLATMVPAVLAAALASGCSGTGQVAAPADAAQPQHGGTITIGLLEEPGVLNQYLTPGGWPAFAATNPMTDPWVDVDEQNQPVPVLATEVPTTANGGVRIEEGRMVVRFGIQPAATWSDGFPITCSDLRFTWKSVMSPKWDIGSRIVWDRIEEIRCPTSKRAEIVFSEPYAGYIELLRRPPYPEHELEGKDFDEYWNNEMTVSSGPFVFSHWNRGVEMVMVRNDDYWNAGPRDLPYADRIVLKFYKDRNTLDLQLAMNEVDLINRALEVPLDQERETFPRNVVAFTPGTGIEHFGFRTDNPPTDDLNVRLAIAYALDRQEIVDRILGEPFAVAQSTLIPVQKPFYTPSWQAYAPDAARVEQLLTDAGYTRTGQWWQKDGQVLHILFKASADRVFRLRIAQLVQEQLKAQGIRVEIRLEDPPVFFGQSLPRGSFNMAMWGLGIGMDPEQKGYFLCDESIGQENAYRYCNDEVGRLLRQSDATLDVQARGRIVRQIQEQMARDIAVIPLYQAVDEMVSSPQLHGLRQNPQAHLTWNIAEWWKS